MREFWLMLLAAAAFSGCGAANKSEVSYAPEQLSFDSYGGAAPASEMDEEVLSHSLPYPEHEADYDLAPGAPSPVTQPQGSSGESTAKPEEQRATAVESPMVIYTAHLRLRVKRLLEAVEAITDLAKQRGGYLESVSHELVVVRVPALDFDETVKQFAAVGTLLWKRVEAQDVTAAFHDLQRRADVARWARERLLQLLEKERDVNERLRILAEIKRQTELIESIDAQLETYRNLVDYFTLFIELEPVVANVATVEHCSPFTWIQQLVAHSQTIEKGGDDVALALPQGFVLFDEDDGYVARAADTTILRAGRVDNEPRGDNDFWVKALDFEMDGRDEEIVKAGTAGRLAYRVYRDRDVQPRLYLVAVLAAAEDLWVVEVFFPNQASWQAHGAAVEQALSSFEVH